MADFTNTQALIAAFTLSVSLPLTILTVDDVLI